MNTTPNITLKILAGTYGVSRLSPTAPIPSWISPGGFTSISRTDEELSIVCLDQTIPHEVCSQKSWRIIKVLGPLDFSLVGILSSISSILAEVQISIFAVSTYDTDYILVQENSLAKAIDALKVAKYLFFE
jgi:hypothetical protein